MSDQSNASNPPERSGGRPGGGGPPGGRRRQPPTPAQVVSVAQITPRLLSVTVKGDLERFAEALPTSHVKLFLPVPGQDGPTMPIMTPEGRVWPEGQPMPNVRTYTPCTYSAARGTLDLQFVLHGEGPATQWAQSAQVGGKLAIAGPGGRFTPDLSTARWWLAADESALPALGTLLDALPGYAQAEIHVEVDGPEDEIPLESAAELKVSWHHRRTPDAFGTELYEAAAAATIVSGTQVWVACESSAVRRIRRLMLEAKQVPLGLLVTRGYWQVGKVDHPDHDYGED